ncbi:response regulator transcription factor [Paenibacillus woosongensis]|uniref:Heme response regulator HssR n=1 Tax=Paenibacillus woosongensis TaxID=307580 RepID=A0AA95I1K2_9BACL|nr:response regulator transcription factor [Paenibacillus woosongensis]WHX47901.1 response regulator transcription factor [Paenibacillus woosongensis]
MKIIVIDDDKNILQLVSIHLTREGYQVLNANNASEALDMLESEVPDLAVVDVMMPGMDGIELTKILSKDYGIPVLLLTAKGELEDKTKGFLAGSEDYVVKPFEPKELLFRIAVILRRFEKEYQSVIQVGNVTISRQTYEVSTGERTLVMPLKEFELLALLASRPNHIMERSMIMEKIWGHDYEGDDYTLNTHIKRLRERLKQLGANVEISTTRGVGYRLEVPHS